MIPRFSLSLSLSSFQSNIDTRTVYPIVFPIVVLYYSVLNIFLSAQMRVSESAIFPVSEHQRSATTATLGLHFPLLVDLNGRILQDQILFQREHKCESTVSSRWVIYHRPTWDFAAIRRSDSKYHAGFALLPCRIGSFYRMHASQAAFLWSRLPSTTSTTTDHWYHDHTPLHAQRKPPDMSISST